MAPFEVIQSTFLVDLMFLKPTYDHWVYCLEEISICSGFFSFSAQHALSLFHVDTWNSYILLWHFLIQCGHGTTNDQLRPTCISLSGTQVERVAAGLWHTICVTVDGRVYAFGGNQFGQLGTGADQAEVYLQIT